MQVTLIVVKMKKQLIIGIVMLALIQLVSALDECKGTMNNNEVPCLLFIENSSSNPCATMSVSVYSNTSGLIYTQSMDQFTSFLCNGTFNITDYGTYPIQYSSGDTGSIVIEEDVDNRYYLYIIALIVFIILLCLGYQLEDSTYTIISGIISAVIAINIYFNGFPNLVNEFLKNGIVIVLAAIGFYLILIASINKLEEW